MAPSRNSRRESVTSLDKHENGLAGHESAAAGSISAVVMAKSATEIAPSLELADVFKADLDNIKSLVTCTICDQLLYEPWMLACGHTYCYSCLCNWFLPNRRSKSCPDCRSAVKAMPAPAFVIKQLAEVFVNRVELMPADESTEQHIKRRKEENQAVETDRISDEGLFKGCFSATRLGNIRYDEADRMHVCSHCGHEFTGGPLCENCGVDFDGEDEAIRDDFSDLEEMEFDLDDEDDEDAEEGEGEDDGDDDDYFHDMDPREGLDWFNPFENGALQLEDVRQLLDRSPIHHHHHHHHPHHPHYHHFIHPMEAVESRARGAHSDESEEEESDGDETTSSMMDFIEPDDSSPVVGRRSRPQIIDSDSDDSNEEEEEKEDEEDEVVSARPRQQARRRRPNRPIVLDSDSEVSADSGDGHEESEEASHITIGDEHESDSSARNGGYSPLDHGDDSDNDEVEPFAAVDHHSDTSDSDTTVGRHELDDEEGEGAASRNNGPAVSRRPGEVGAQRCPFHIRSGSRAKRQREGISAAPQSSSEQSHEDNPEDHDEERSSSPVAEYDASDDDNEVTDQDGDIEMGAKSTTGMRGSVPEPDLLNHNALDDFYGGDRSLWLDEPVQPAPRSRRRRGAPARMLNTQEYDPRISMMFAQHQSDLRDATARESPLYEDQSDIPRRIEAPARSRRRAQYRMDQPVLSNRFGPNREPIVISSSTRPGRAHRNRREYRA